MRRREFAKLVAAMAVWPITASAQKPMPVIGILSSSTASPSLPTFHQGLSETGYVENQNVAIEYRWNAGSYDGLPAMAADLVGCKVGVIHAIGGGPYTRRKMQPQRSRSSLTPAPIR